MAEQSPLMIWNKICHVPEDMLTLIRAGRLAGKSDINPGWRLKALTETFGPCGVGWKIVIDRIWSEVSPETKEIFGFVQISLYIRDDDKAWSEAIPGLGGGMLVAKEKEGLHASDDAYKGALTDAISVATKLLGMAGDVYMKKQGAAPGPIDHQEPGRGSYQKPSMTPPPQQKAPAAAAPKAGQPSFFDDPSKDPGGDAEFPKKTPNPEDDGRGGLHPDNCGCELVGFGKCASMKWCELKNKSLTNFVKYYSEAIEAGTPDPETGEIKDEVKAKYIESNKAGLAKVQAEMVRRTIPF